MVRSPDGLPGPTTVLPSAFGRSVTARTDRPTADPTMACAPSCAIVLRCRANNQISWMPTAAAAASPIAAAARAGSGPCVSPIRPKTVAIDGAGVIPLVIPWTRVVRTGRIDALAARANNATGLSDGKGNTCPYLTCASGWARGEGAG